MLTFRKTPEDPAALIRKVARPLGLRDGVGQVLTEIGDASIVLLGEATHGTEEFYELRSQITRALVEERGFSAVAVEGDWPEADQVNRFVRGDGETATANEALSGFSRFPTWMWRNTAVETFVNWMKTHNAQASATRKVGFYGLDLYSLNTSIRAVIDYLDHRHPEAARAARASYGCFEEFGHDTETYAWAATRLGNESCEDAVARELTLLREQRDALTQRGNLASADAFFSAEQNARLALNAEHYYRTMTRGQTASWNIRDQHMAETLEALRSHLQRRGSVPKIVVWAHNSHVGDARATEPGEQGQLNLGQLVRERYGADCKLIGFTTYTGTVVAASDWGEPPQRKQVRPALTGSYEEVFHDAEIPRFFLSMGGAPVARSWLNQPHLQRAIGVIYRPETERSSHYFTARIADQFDAVIHIDRTKGVEPLERIPTTDPSEVAETFPSGV